MAARRHQVPSPLSCSPRSALNSASHQDVDSILKQLRSCTRRLQIALSSHRLELQVLERLYYKGKNQHRTALFWRRVVEIRRYGDRLQEMDAFNLVENIRLLFWGDTTLHSAKVLKGPWTHTPDVKYVRLVLQRCADCRQLMDKTQERLRAAYHSFTLLVQTAAFLQLSLTLVAIASRICSLLGDAQVAIEMCQTACFRTLQILDPQEAQKMIHLAGNLGSSSRKLSAVEITVPQPQIIMPDKNIAEDLGDVVQRAPSPPSEDTPANVLLNTEALSLHLEAPYTAEATTNDSIVQVVREPIQRASGKPSILPDSKPAEVTRKRGVDSQEKTPSKKKKKKKTDEIDDIFGF